LTGPLGRRNLWIDGLRSRIAVPPGNSHYQTATRSNHPPNRAPTAPRGTPMSDASPNVLSPEIVHREMKKNGVTDVVWLPDSETNWLYLLMKADPDLRLVGVSREGHACSIAAGLSAGGKRPIILIQNTGLMESGDSIRGWLLGLDIPVVLMVGYRGYTRHGVNKDTAATFTERFLNAFGLQYYLVESDADAPRISIAFEEADRTKRPVVILVADEFHGFNR
jgi:sulfopyruvate decarboxylase TPP-binding subunit